MPIYEYHCNNCGNEFELMQSMDSDKEKECPSCKSPAQRKISASAFHLKGGGWYTTDYKPKQAESCSAKTDSPACAGCVHANNDK